MGLEMDRDDSPVEDMPDLGEEDEGSETSEVPLSDGQPGQLGIVQLGFHAKSGFDANTGLVQTRSDALRPRLKPIVPDIWKRPPPDFRPQLFGPNPAKRNSRDAVQPWKYGTIPGQRERYTRLKAQSLVLQSVLAGSRSVDSHFLTSFHVPDPFESKLEFVKEGVYPAGPYYSPKPHDFRGYPPIKSLGLPEFETAYEHDPYNLNFKSQRLNIYHGLNTAPPTIRHLGQQMAPPLPRQPKWETELILPQNPWPRRPASFTRHRRIGRPPHSAFMDRVEETLTARWAKEKLEQDLRRHELRNKADELTS